MNKMKVVLDEGAYMPKKAHAADAGYDLFTPDDFILEPEGTALVDTGVHMEIPVGYVGMIKSKSGLNVKYNIQCEGVVDAGYTGSIMAKLYNHGKKRLQFEKGDKITQICIIPVAHFELQQVDALEDTERGDGGFGSTGSK